MYWVINYNNKIKQIFIKNCITNRKTIYKVCKYK